MNRSRPSRRAGLGNPLGTREPAWFRPCHGKSGSPFHHRLRPAAPDSRRRKASATHVSALAGIARFLMKLHPKSAPRSASPLAGWTARVIAGRWAVLLLALTALAPLTNAAKARPEAEDHQGMCGASAAVAVDAEHFLVANDEDSVLRLYAAHHPGPPVKEFDLSSVLQLPKKHQETDLEAAARVADRVYWISSHGRDADGNYRAARHRFFATRLSGAGASLRVELEGQPYAGLVDALLGEPALARYGFAAAVKRAPKERGGFNIEGLCARPDGSLLIGLRNPVSAGRALLLPLLNPAEVIMGQSARLAAAMEVDLGGLGVRDMVRVGQRYLILAGPVEGGSGFAVYWWDGDATPPRKLPVNIKGTHPEAALIYQDTEGRTAQLLSDDGKRQIRGCACEELKDRTQRRFRSFWINLPVAP